MSKINSSKYIKSNIKHAFDYPKPMHKKEFMDSIAYKTNRVHKTTKANNRVNLFFHQLYYIRKRVWLISLLFFILTLYVFKNINSESMYSSIWIVSSFTPFLSLMTILEVAKSSIFKMDELEMSCKYNLSDIILIRSSLLGIFNMIVLIIATVLLSSKLNYSIYKLGLYILTPFILTNICSFIASSNIKGDYATYTCLSISSIVSIIYYIFTTEFNSCFNNYTFTVCWSIIFAVLLIVSCVQFVFLIKNKEIFQ